MTSGSSRKREVNSAPSMQRRVRPRSFEEERGQVLVMFVIFLVGLLAIAALVVDVGHIFQLRRHLQASADAAALAAAQDLPDTTAATAVANEYSGSAGGRNERSNLPPVTTAVSFPGPVGSKVKVTQTATANIFFAGIVGFGGFNVSATAVASKTSETTGTPLAVYVHELCGAATGNKGFIAAGHNMRIEGAIHVNGQFTIGSADFDSVGPASVYRPTAGSPAGPAQGSCAGAAPLHIQDRSDSMYCSGCPGGAMSDPSPGQWRDWITIYHSEAIMKSFTPCTYTYTSDVKFENSTIPSGVHCLPKDKKFTIAGNASGNITVIAGMLEVGGSGSLKPYDSSHPVLFYSTNTAGTAIKLNPSAAYDWSGYIINRFGGIEVNAAGVSSPQDGLLEGEWVHINGENFTMLGTFADSPEGNTFGAVSLEE
jgi:Flp pilus assembly protein TadG